MVALPFRSAKFDCSRLMESNTCWTGRTWKLECLAIRFAEQVQDEFDGVIWRSRQLPSGESSSVLLVYFNPREIEYCWQKSDRPLRSDKTFDRTESSLKPEGESTRCPPLRFFVAFFVAVCYVPNLALEA